MNSLIFHSLYSVSKVISTSLQGISGSSNEALLTWGFTCARPGLTQFCFHQEAALQSPSEEWGHRGPSDVGDHLGNNHLRLPEPGGGCSRLTKESPEAQELLTYQVPLTWVGNSISFQT